MSRKATTRPVDFAKLPLIDEEDSRQFVMVVKGHRARMEYDRTPDRIFLTHLMVPPAIEEQDVAAALTEKVLGWVESKGMKVVPYCPYVRTYLRRHTAWQRLLVKGVQI
ncbi:MAG: N-acetyltransferase [Flavobacteriales bacterium]|nr:N-acetyltransferase [Flavobacteriales bacterium]